MASHSVLSDPELVALLQQRDDAAFAEIYQRYWSVLFLHARNLLRNEEEAEDITQELFTQLWQKAPGLELTGTSLSAYLYRAVRNRVFDHLKHRRVVNDYVASLNTFLEEGTVEADVLVREKELARIIEYEIALLPKKMRVIFELSRKQHLSYAQIAEQLDISEHTVKSQVSNALHILRAKVGPAAMIVACLFHHN